uniref:Antimicrobial peptide n=1 Tax=Trematomus bernacchii TaxID=40690 RepID=A0A4Y1PGC5_TREBE|nr:Antimicrobial peptide [Trematomus bernacchii]
MKCTIVFLVLSMVVLMAEPGDAFFGHLLRGIVSVGKHIHGLITGRNPIEQEAMKEAMREQEAMDQQAFDRERAFA